MLSEEIDDPNSLLELQRFNLAKIESTRAENGVGGGIDSVKDSKIEINFTAEPRKSKK